MRLLPVFPKNSLVVFLIPLFLFCSFPAYAHKVIMELYVSDNIIEGEIGFSDGSMAKNEIVEVFDANGTKLGETKTDDQGAFSFTATVKTDHLFKSNLGAGHIAEAQLSADEISLPDQSSSSGLKSAPTNTVQPVEEKNVKSTSTFQGTSAALPEKELQALIAEAVRKEVRPLQKELASYREKNDVQSILGGIGYILGLFGISFYLAARHRVLKEKI